MSEYHSDCVLAYKNAEDVFLSSSTIHLAARTQCVFAPRPVESKQYRVALQQVAVRAERTLIGLIKIASSYHYDSC